LSITISEHDYRQLGKYLKVASDSVPAKGIWLAFLKEYNTGSRQGDVIKLTASNRFFIREKVKDLVGFDPVDDPAEKLEQCTTTENSERGKNEKFLSLKPRESYLEYRILSQDSETTGYLGGEIYQVIAHDISTVISIENFDTFASIQYAQLSEAIGSSESIIIVYRGDNTASPKAVLTLRNNFQGKWFHFGDFDPQGINIGIVEMRANALILPSLDGLRANLSLSQKDVFLRQNKNLIYAHLKTPLSEYLELMEAKELAIMQQHICAHQLPLVNVSVS
jgi:hypothetical protein